MADLSADIQEVTQWAASKKLSVDTVKTLIAYGYESMDALETLTPEDISKAKIPVGQMKLLLKAVRNTFLAEEAPSPVAAQQTPNTSAETAAATSNPNDLATAVNSETCDDAFVRVVMDQMRASQANIAKSVVPEPLWNQELPPEIQENLCRHPTTSVLQSSTYKSNIATLVIDGDKRTSEKYCAHTEVNQTKAWLQVDLGQPFNIGSVKIFYRKEGLWKPYRFRQFYLDVSNTSATQTKRAHRTRCYTDNTTYQAVPPNVIDIPCKHITRYVIVETTYDAPEDNPTTGAILEICEIEVYGYNSGETNAASKHTTTATLTAITTTGGDRVYSGLPTLGTTATRHYRGEPVATTLPLPVNTNSSTITAAGIPADDQYNLSQKSNNTESILYVMLPVLCTSLVINICTITWILKNNACKRQDVIQDRLKRDTKFTPTSGIYMYRTADDGTVYQELDQLSGPSHYSQL